jgi:TDG/mug DNA glycosylase family protein
MDPQTIEAYEAGAAAYLANRRAYAVETATAFAAAVPEGRWRADLGCGPGHYLRHLGTPVVALDAAHAMLRLAPTTARVQGDLTALPLRSACLGGAWASKSYQHLPHELLPTALADLHRTLTVGASVELTLFAGTGRRRTDADDDLPDRWFWFWEPDHLADVLTGAGMEVERVWVDGPGEAWPRLRASCRRARTLPDHVGPGMRLLVCGLNPSHYAADRGVNFARPGNRFWPAMRAAGLVTLDRDPRHALRHHAIGMTDLVKRATVAAVELTAVEYADGVGRLDRLCRWLRPGAVCLIGLAGWRAAVDRGAVAGWQDRHLGGVPVYVMPNTSGLNASTQLDGFVDHLRAAAGTPPPPPPPQSDPLPADRSR